MLGAVDIGTGATSVFLDEVAPEPPYNLWLGLAWAVDTEPPLPIIQRVKEAGIASALRASNIRVIDSARPPARPYKPSLPLNVALGLLTGVFFGIVFVVMRERADQSIQAPGEAPAYLNVPELGVIPSAQAVQRAAHFYHRDTESTENEGRKVELVTWQNRPSVLAESFRATLASIVRVSRVTS